MITSGNSAQDWLGGLTGLTNAVSAALRGSSGGVSIPPPIVPPVTYGSAAAPASDSLATWLPLVAVVGLGAIILTR